MHHDDQPPAVHLRCLLAADRRQGLTFEQAWTPRTTALIAGIRSAKERDDWQTVLDQTKPVWKLAYKRSAARRRACPLDAELIAA